MSISRQEELISALWVICAILCFEFGHPIWGWIFTTKATFDTLAAIRHVNL